LPATRGPVTGLFPTQGCHPSQKELRFAEKGLQKAREMGGAQNPKGRKDLTLRARKRWSDSRKFLLSLGVLKLNLHIEMALAFRREDVGFLFTKELKAVITEWWFQDPWKPFRLHGTVFKHFN
jgi:hypothetical protein